MEVAFVTGAAKHTPLPQDVIAQLESTILRLQPSEFSDPENRGKLLLLLANQESSEELVDLLIEITQSEDMLVALAGVYGLGMLGCCDRAKAVDALIEWKEKKERTTDETEVAAESLELLRQCDEGTEGRSTEDSSPIEER